MMKGTYVKHIDGSISSCPVAKPITTFKELQESQLTSVIAIPKHKKEGKDSIINQKHFFNYFSKLKNGEIQQ